MKVVRTVLLICALIGSFALPIFFLAVRRFHLEDQTSEWIVSMWPQSQWSVALEDRRAVADMLVTYGELSAMNMLAWSAISWSALFIFSRFFRRPGARDDSLRLE
jgi:hypothetical protein